MGLEAGGSSDPASGVIVGDQIENFAQTSDLI